MKKITGFKANNGRVFESAEEAVADDLIERINKAVKPRQGTLIAREAALWIARDRHAIIEMLEAIDEQS